MEGNSGEGMLASRISDMAFLGMRLPMEFSDLEQVINWMRQMMEKVEEGREMRKGMEGI